MAISHMLNDAIYLKFNWVNLLLLFFCMVSPFILKKFKNTMTIIFILFYALVGYVSTGT